MNSEEFSQMVRGTHFDQVGFRDYVIAELRCARIRAQLILNEIEVIGKALTGNVIGPEFALEWCYNIGADELVHPEAYGGESEYYAADRGSGVGDTETEEQSDAAGGAEIGDGVSHSTDAVGAGDAEVGPDLRA